MRYSVGNNQLKYQCRFSYSTTAISEGLEGLFNCILRAIGHSKGTEALETLGHSKGTWALEHSSTRRAFGHVGTRPLETLSIT